MASGWSSHQPQKDPPPFFLDEYDWSLAALSMSPFVKLSREMRDNIYDLLWEGEYYPSCDEGDCSFALAYGAADEEPEFSQTCAWLLTCKAFLAEGTMQFYRKARCVDICKWSYSVSPAKSDIVSLSRVRHIDFKVKHTPSPFEIILHRDFWASATEARLKEDVFYRPRQVLDEHEVYEKYNLGEWVDIKRYGDPKTFGLVIPNYDGMYAVGSPEAGLNSLIDYLGVYKHALQTMRLNFSPPYYILGHWSYEGVQIPETWHVDMSYLEKLGSSFDKIEFTLGEASIQKPWYLEIYRKIQQELGRIAKYLIGGSNGGYWALQDWVAKDGVGAYSGRKCWHLEVRRLRSGPSTGHIASHASNLGENSSSEDEFEEENSHEVDRENEST